jgi:gamma-D-glutamyl-L-lysine dipeptidyl-peptidase
MPAVIAIAPVAPLFAQPSVRAEQSNQLVLGETGSQMDRQGDWLRICTHQDDYDGWMHSGYVKVVEDDVAAAWRVEAEGWSEGILVQAAGWHLSLPLRARIGLEQGTVVLPDGRKGHAANGQPRVLSEVVSAARRTPPERWAAEYFLGASYQWGGVTPWGVDCSGLVQTTFSARGVKLPRDAAQQVKLGDPVPSTNIRAGDLLYFSSESGSGAITHVAFAGDGETLVHSTLACGGVVIESRLPGSRAAPLMQRLNAIRRLEVR